MRTPFQNWNTNYEPTTTAGCPPVVQILLSFDLEFVYTNLSVPVMSVKCRLLDFSYCNKLSIKQTRSSWREECDLRIVGRAKESFDDLGSSRSSSANTRSCRTRLSSDFSSPWYLRLNSLSATYCDPLWRTKSVLYRIVFGLNPLSSCRVPCRWTCRVLCRWTCVVGCHIGAGVQLYFWL